MMKLLVGLALWATIVVVKTVDSAAVMMDDTEYYEKSHHMLDLKSRDKRSISNLLMPLLNGLGVLAGGSSGNQVHHGAATAALLNALGSLFNSGGGGSGMSYGSYSGVDGRNVIGATPITDTYGAGTSAYQQQPPIHSGGSGIDLKLDLSKMSRNLMNGYQAGKMAAGSSLGGGGGGGGGGLLAALLNGLNLVSAFNPGHSASYDMYEEPPVIQPGMQFDFPKPMKAPARSKAKYLPPPPQQQQQQAAYQQLSHTMSHQNLEMPYNAMHTRNPNEHEVSKQMVQDHAFEIPANSVREKPSSPGGYIPEAHQHHSFVMSTMEPARPNKPNYSTQELATSAVTADRSNKIKSDDNQMQQSYYSESDLPAVSSNSGRKKFHRDANFMSSQDDVEKNNYARGNVDGGNDYRHVSEVSPSTFHQVFPVQNDQSSVQVPLSTGIVVTTDDNFNMPTSNNPQNNDNTGELKHSRSYQEVASNMGDIAEAIASSSSSSDLTFNNNGQGRDSDFRSFGQRSIDAQQG